MKDKSFRVGPNAKHFILQNAALVAARVARGDARVWIRTLAPAEAAALGHSAPDSTVQQVEVPVHVDRAGTSYIGIHWTTGTPSIRLKLPNGTILTEATVNGTSQQFLRDLQAAQQ